MTTSRATVRARRHRTSTRNTRDTLVYCATEGDARREMISRTRLAADVDILEELDMRSSVVIARAAGVAATLLALAVPAGAQLASAATSGTTTVAGRTLDVTPYGGYMLFGSFVDGPLGTSLSSSAAPVYGAQLGLALMPGVKLVGNVAHASGDLRVGIPLLGGIDAGKTSALVMDGGLELSIPTPKGAIYAPFVQAGVGAMRWSVDLGSTGLVAKSSNLTGNLGAGLDVNLGPSMAVRLMAKDYIGKFDFKEATSFDVSGKTANNWAITAGLKLAF
ncbi:MAG: hypothetical protein HOQ11_13400 [Gemmatimonadaceae bacterium]|nr:hypothetical protein [Gemmatimonadaceae bacterium]NUS98395.1 hypothetical protein [Gemmatimonadaceae bacterium]